MNKRKRLEYLIITASVFLSGFIIYGFVGSMQPLINDNKAISFLACGVFGGFGFSIILSTIILSSRFFTKRGLAFKVISAILWPITFACCFYAGVFMYIPYGIYNIIMLIKKEPQEKENSLDSAKE